METPAIEVKKYVIDYQATDAEGNPIGHATHLEADTPEEMFEKQKEAHINASRALARQNKAFNELKARKLTPKEQPAPPRFTPEEERQIASGINNPATAKDSIRKIGGIEEIEARLQNAEAEARNARGQAIAYTFMRNHLHDYYPCDANKKIIGDYLAENNLEGNTVDNLEIAFAAVQDQLATDPRQATPTNPTIAPPINAQPSSTVRQPGFGMQPGVGSGTRPAPHTGNGKLTKAAILAKKKADPSWWKKAIADPRQLAEINEALARG